MRKVRESLPELHELIAMSEYPEIFMDVINEKGWMKLLYGGFATDEGQKWNQSLKFIRIFYRKYSEQKAKELEMEKAQAAGKLF